MSRFKAWLETCFGIYYNLAVPKSADLFFSLWGGRFKVSIVMIINILSFRESLWLPNCSDFHSQHPPMLNWYLHFDKRNSFSGSIKIFGGGGRILLLSSLNLEFFKDQNNTNIMQCQDVVVFSRFYLEQSKISLSSKKKRIKKLAIIQTVCRPSSSFYELKKNSDVNFDTWEWLLSWTKDQSLKWKWAVSWK